MDFRPKNTRRSLIKLNQFKPLHEQYPHFMQLYRVPPNFEIAFKEFEECTAERLALLQTINEVNSRGLKGEEWRKSIIEEIRKQPELRAFSKIVTATSCGSEEADFMIRRRDHVSHFVLRLAYCDTEDKRRWFVSRELDLFKLRWMYLSPEQRTSFLLLNHLNYDLVSEKEKLELAKDSDGLVKTSQDYYRIPFVQVSDLVRQRKVFLRYGYAFITSEDIISVILTSYRTHLAQSLAYASRRLHTLDEDERIFGILKGASKTSREVNYSISDHKQINIADLDRLSETSYPLCMQHLHQTIRKEHHLKHFSRLQYGLFLKGIGVTLDDALRFWRQEFTKKIDLEKFEKSYAYSIRHNYGKEGKMANYSPHSCLKIIGASVNPGDHHGCPFRHKDATVVKKSLQDNGLSSVGVQEVIDLMRKGHYQLACSKVFQLKHGVDSAVVNHPNLYFDESQALLSGRVQSAKKEPPTGPVKQKPQIKTENQASGSNVWADDSGYDFSSIVVD